MTRPSLSGKRAAPGTAPATAVGDQATDPVYDRTEYGNNGNPSPGGGQRKGHDEEEDPPEERAPLFIVADHDLDKEMAHLFRGDGEREIRFMVRRFRRHRGVTTLLPVGRKSASGVRENSAFMKRYREGKQMAAVSKGDTFQNRM